jgi:hypothetical protein
MATIDQLDLSVYNLYAIRTKMIEQINQELRLDQAASIPPQTQLVDNFPKLAEIDILLGILPLNTPWAFFYPPQKFRRARRSSFSFYRIVPSLGSLEEQAQVEQMIDSVECNTPEEVSEKAAIKNCFKQIGQINRWMGYIIGRIGQFLQG